MAWIPITEADILTVMAAPELAGYRLAALKLVPPQDDPVAPVTRQVVNLVRGYVGANKANHLGAGLTIPEKLLAPALDIIVVRIPLRVGIAPRKGRDTAAQDAIDLLKSVALGRFDIEEPVEVTEEKSSSPPDPIIVGRCRQFTREQQDGI